MLSNISASFPFSVIQYLSDRKWRYARFSLAWLLVALGLSTPALPQENLQPRDLPIIKRITPNAAAPQTHIELEGYRLGAELNEGVRVLFVQGAAEYWAVPNGTGYVNGNLKQGLHELNVIVPKQLQPGPCLVLVEVTGTRSEPFMIRINIPATAPVLVDLKPHLPQAGEMVWIEGSGFSDSDDIVLTDATGNLHHFNGGGTSDADTLAFTLPKDLPVGEALLRVVERRTGTGLSSDSLPLAIVHGPTPLHLESDWLMPVAPGQWLDLVVGSFDPLKSAERVEVMFHQQEQTLVALTRGPGENDLRVRVPESLAPGNVKIQTRTLISDEASDWSDPVDYKLLDKPVAAKIFSLAIQPVRAEAAFKENDKIVAIVPVTESDYPKVRVPTDKLSAGLVTVMTRVWRGGEPSPWLFKNTGFDWPTKFLPDGTMGEVPFMERIYFGPDTAKELTVYPGEKLILQGTFPVESVDDLEVSLHSHGRDPIVLKLIGVTNPRGAKVTLPDDLEGDDWSINVLNMTDRASVTLPITLRFGNAFQGRKIE
jgi:hypothetical protein